MGMKTKTTLNASERQDSKGDTLKNIAVKLDVGETTVKDWRKVIKNLQFYTHCALLKENQNQKSLTIHYNCSLFKNDNTELR